MGFVHSTDTWEAICSFLKKCNPDACRTLDYISREIEAGAICAVYQEVEFGLAADTIVFELLINSTGEAAVYKFHIDANALPQAHLEARREALRGVFNSTEEALRGVFYSTEEGLRGVFNSTEREGDII